MRLIARQAGRYVHIVDQYTPLVHTSRGPVMPQPDLYFMDIVAVDDTTFTYNSFIERAGFLEPRKVGRVAQLAPLLEEIAAGHLIISPASAPAH